MALSKQKILGSGTLATYWRIVQLNCNYDRDDAICTLALYLNAEARDSGFTPIGTAQLNLSSSFHSSSPKDGETVLKNITLKEAYKSIKSLAIAEAALPEDERNKDLSFFSDAEDV